MVKPAESGRQAPSYDACLVEAELRARSCYAEPGRHYHGIAHLDDCLTQLAAAPGLVEADARILRWAVLWHDAVYDARRSDNEEASAALARRELQRCGVDKAQIDEVERLILLTKGHRVEERDRLGALLVSIDLSILGSSAERYRAYAEAVRREYAHVPEEAWRSARAAVLERLLDADPLFPDAGFRERLEAAARRNRVEELSSLRAG